jgi:hypothetical protein
MALRRTGMLFAASQHEHPCTRRAELAETEGYRRPAEEIRLKAMLLRAPLIAATAGPCSARRPVTHRLPLLSRSLTVIRHSLDPRPCLLTPAHTSPFPPRPQVGSRTSFVLLVVVVPPPQLPVDPLQIAVYSYTSRPSSRRQSARDRVHIAACALGLPALSSCQPPIPTGRVALRPPKARLRSMPADLPTVQQP